MSEEDLSALYDRLRETEAQTREQSVQLKALADSNTALSSKVDKMMDKWDKQIDTMWKWFGVLIGALIVAALGPKVASELLHAGNASAQYQPIFPAPNHDMMSKEYRV